MACLIEDLRHTTIARWYTRALDGTDQEADSWERPENGAPTRIRYYQAFLSNIDKLEAHVNLAHDRSRKHQLRDAVLRAASARSASTLYTLAGPRAPGSMLVQARDDITASAGPRRDVVARLCAEVKVWRHWPYRVGWLAQLGEADPHSRQLAAASLIRVLAVWAHENQRLASTCDCDPPLSVVEDLLVIAAGRASAAQVRELLTIVIDAARGPLGASPHDVFEAVSDELAKLGLAGRPTFCELADRLTESLAGLKHLWPHLDGAERSRLNQKFSSEFADLAAIVDGGHGS